MRKQTSRLSPSPNGFQSPKFSDKKSADSDVRKALFLPASIPSEDKLLFTTILPCYSMLLDATRRNSMYLHLLESQSMTTIPLMASMHDLFFFVSMHITFELHKDSFLDSPLLFNCTISLLMTSF
jgi:hypothetical protein